MSRLSFISALLLPLLAARATAQVLSAGVEVLGVSFGGTTYYGEFRTYSATVVGVGVGTGQFAGNVSFVCGSTLIAQAPLVPSTAALQVSPNQLATSLQINLLNQVISQNGLVLGGINLGPILGIVGGITMVTAANLNTPVVQTLLNSLSPVTVNAAAVASVTTPYTPVINCTAATIVYSGVTLGGQPLLGAPTLNPLLPLSPTLFSFAVLPAPTAVTLPGGTTFAAPFNSTFVLPVTVTNTDANSVIAPNGGSVIVVAGAAAGRRLLQTTVIGTAPVVSPASGLTSLVNVLVSTGPPLVAGTTAALSVLFSGNVDFLPSLLPAPGLPVVITPPGTSPVVGSTTPPVSPQPPPSSFPTAATVALTPATSFINGPVAISGTVASAGGGTPTGTVVVTNNGVTLPAVPVSATGAYSVATVAPAAPGLDVVTATFIPSAGSGFQPSPTAQATLSVTLPGTTFTNLAGNPNPAIAGAPDVLTGTVTAANGAPPTGTVQAVVNGVLSPATATLVPGAVSSTFSLPVIAPGTVGPANVSFLYIPGPGFAGPATLPTLTLAVAGAPPTIVVIATPNPAAPGGNVTVGGTIASTGGGSPAGTAIVTLNGQTYTAAVNPGAAGAPGSFSLVVPVPAAPGTYPLGVTFAPAPGSSTAAGSTTLSLGVSAASTPPPAASTSPPATSKTPPPSTTPPGPPAGGANPGLTITLGGGGASTAFNFPNCLAPLVVGVGTTAAPGLAPPTGSVALAVTGGKLGTNALMIGQAALSGGAVTITVSSAEVKKDILVEAVAKLAALGGSAHDALPTLVPAGHVLVLPGDYTLEAIYPGDANYAAAIATVPLSIAPGCGLADLFI